MVARRFVPGRTPAARGGTGARGGVLHGPRPRRSTSSASRSSPSPLPRPSSRRFAPRSPPSPRSSGRCGSALLCRDAVWCGAIVVEADGSVVDDGTDLDSISEGLRLVAIDGEEGGDAEAARAQEKSDEELARLIQAEEEALLLQQCREEVFREGVELYMRQVLMYEGPVRQVSRGSTEDGSNK